ncbi:MAG: hypothetical protein ACFFCE_17450 [Promethearchaeota archaeon]
MDTSSDFIRPEFLNILFFQQKNLVIFPYIDLKHLHTLEIYTVGYNIIDLESTALNNLKEIIEFESTNSYSQNPTLYFIYNVDRKNVKELMELNGIRCVINSNENISDLINGTKFIFFNKKNNQFLNYENDNSELEFENHLISASQDEEILLEKIHEIKMAASRIFRELNQKNNLDRLSDILQEFDQKYWDPILQFTRLYYDINIPNISKIKSKKQKILKDFSKEYELLISNNKPIGKEFIQLLHEYRSKKVNPHHLKLEELYNPLKLYNYLRNHHWKNGIPKDFISEWIQMKISGYKFNESDQEDFKIILKMLELYPDSSLLDHKNPLSSLESKKHSKIIPSLYNEWDKFKLWLVRCINDIEAILEKNNTFPEDQSYLMKNFLEIINLITIKPPFKSKEREFNNNLLLVDISNLLNMDKDENDKIKVNNIQKVRDVIISIGYTPRMIADASMRHHIDDDDKYKEFIEKKIILQAPAGTEADEYILEIAKVEKSRFLTNDMFEKYWKEFGKDWIFQNRLTCLFFNGKFIIRNNIKR